MWWTRGERLRRCGGRGGACCGRHGADDQAGVDGAALDGERAGRAVRRRGRSLEDDRAGIRGTGSGFAPPSGRARGRDDGRILVTVVSTSRLPVVSEMSRARWPSSPTACSCGCLHRGSNAQAVSKTGEAVRSLARADGQRKWRRASAGAESTESGRRGSGHRARAASCACSMRTGLARAAAGPTEAVPHTWRPAGLGGTPVDGGLVSLGCEEVGDDVDRGMDHLARILVPRRVHCDVCAWRAVCVRSGVCCGWAIVLISHGGGAKRAGLERRSHLELKRRLHLELKGVELRFVERRRQGDDEW